MFVQFRLHIYLRFTQTEESISLKLDWRGGGSHYIVLVVKMIEEMMMCIVTKRLVGPITPPLPRSLPPPHLSTKNNYSKKNTVFVKYRFENI